jgi:hypothetical protein
MVVVSSVLSLCRICRNSKLENIYDFGEIALTGVFVEDGSSVLKTPMILCRCTECGLVQLRHSYALEELYGDTYGYESHLNNAMSSHLMAKAKELERLYGNLYDGLSPKTVVDIASNDGTLLSGYSDKVISKIGIDPLISNFVDRYPTSSTKIEEFFSKNSYNENNFPKANIVTSTSVLYDIESPVVFANDVFDILEEGGIWHFEQSYLVSMVETLGFDTICQEHLLYLSLHDIDKILSVCGFKILELDLNEVNGGSIAVTAVKSSEPIEEPQNYHELLEKEIRLGYRDGTMLHNFSTLVGKHIKELESELAKFASEGFQIFGLGASTKGNVLLQSLDYSKFNIIAIGDINSKKFGKETPGTKIPIINESEILEQKSTKTVAIVLPWHFKDGILLKANKYLKAGGTIVIPFPKLEVITAADIS